MHVQPDIRFLLDSSRNYSRLLSSLLFGSRIHIIVPTYDPHEPLIVGKGRSAEFLNSIQDTAGEPRSPTVNAGGVA
jgi:hypothetical protein